MTTLRALRRSTPFVALAVGLLVGWAPADLGAQDAAARFDARWRPWLGCWTPGDTAVISINGRTSPRTFVCVTPTTDGAGVDITSIVSGRGVSRERVVASGARVVRTLDGCPGWESARFSADGQRVLLRSEYTCNGTLPRRESGVFAITPEGEWLDLQGVDVMGSAGVRGMRFRDAGIEVAALSDTRLIDRALRDSAGTAVLRFREGCEIVETTTWSTDRRRATLRAESRCPTSPFQNAAQGPVTRTVAEYTRDSTGSWMQTGGTPGDTVLRLPLQNMTGDSAYLAFERPTGFATRTARVMAASPLSTDDVVEMAKHVDVTVAEAWLTETRQGFDLDARALLRLADSGLPPRMIDLMVALSNPRTFAVLPNGSSVERIRTTTAMRGNMRDMNTVNSIAFGGWGMSSAAMFDQFACARYGYRSRSFGYNNCAMYGMYSPYGYGNGYGPNWYWGNQPVVILPRPGTGTGAGGVAETRGRVVPGRGYTRERDAGSSSGFAAPGAGPAARSSGSSGSSGGSSSGAGSSGGSSGGSSTGRTAKARGG